ncbi:MAG: LysR family transcriptional regulator [Candidatus Competibacteraceae bacterium]|nr:LysR family transcriptional regulator [Candidatus Competibacteraceae bacterium]
MKIAFDRLSLMQTFIRIVEAGSLSAAAAQINVTQPTISRRLQTLERSLRLTLLYRSTHGLQLTEAGARYYARAKELLLSWSEFESDLGRAVDDVRGTLRVVVPHAFGQHQLVGPLATFLATYPQVSIEWLLHDTTPNFLAEGIDCAIHVGDVDALSVVSIRLGEVRRIVVASPALVADCEGLNQPEDLANLPWVALAPYYRHEVRLRREHGEDHALAIQPRVVTDSLYALRSAVLRGVGAAIVSAWVIRGDLARGALVHLVPDWRAPTIPIHLIYPYARFYPAKLRRFVEVMRDSLGNGPDFFNEESFN